MNTVEWVVMILLLIAVVGLGIYVITKECPPCVDKKTPEIDTMYTYTPGVPPPKTINTMELNAQGEQVGSGWNFLWT